jgi:hypothetical protein
MATSADIHARVFVKIGLISRAFLGKENWQTEVKFIPNFTSRR